ncbi:probable pectinesterase/pectinesterase inhibitor 6 [Mangifera indica]|uniref:probable pectinesterase/pectinesterase inhibitor 6 n=1 Tax=Mangifera indica TaxID=29780 RepID=UPI001CF94532|nr:probable pectinesterase/pectinesterase inhibitor 6 [Mangifera indica]
MDTIFFSIFNFFLLISSCNIVLADEFPSWVSAANSHLLQLTPLKADIVVAQDGSGNYRTISEAVVAAAKKTYAKRLVIYVKQGIYKENVEIEISNLTLIGDGIDATIITGNKSARDGFKTFHTATFGVSGYGFVAQGVTFENSAGPKNNQSVALRSSSDRSVFYNCSFKGYQDTLYVYRKVQFYRNCDIYGTVDFIFGYAAVVFQNCNIYVRKPLNYQKNTITAHGRDYLNEKTGIIIHNSLITAAPDMVGVTSIESYLGRPWKKYSRTVFMKCTIDELIHPAGWLPWNGSFALNTLYYGEYLNTGSGANTSARVKWSGYHVIRNSTEASKFTVDNFLGGNLWIPATGVPFEGGL